jgi:hypothetical protein
MIQYPKNTHTTLPSVEGGFGSINIMRDPPKSIVSTYKVKVGEDNKLLDWIDGSGSRVCEGLTHFARGSNPMVSVDYSNSGNNGGQMIRMEGAIGTSQRAIGGGGRQAYLPYRVAKDGAFRPPIMTPQDLLPLSRMPRLPSKYDINIGSKQTVMDLGLGDLYCNKDLRQVRSDILKSFIEPRQIFNIELPQTQASETKYVINNKMAHARNVGTNNGKEMNILQPNRVPERGIQDNRTYQQIFSKQSTQLMGTPVGNDNVPVHIKEGLVGSYKTNLAIPQNNSGYNAQTRTLERNTPLTAATTNVGQRIDLNSGLVNRNYHLPSKNYSQFENGGFQPSSIRGSDQVARRPQSVYNEALQDSARRTCPPVTNQYMNQEVNPFTLQPYYVQ